MTGNAAIVDVEDATKTRLRLWLKLLKVTRRVEGEVREKLRSEFGSTLPRFDVLAALNRFPKGLRMSELSDVLKVSNGNVTGIVDRLVKDGLIIRSAVPGDRRALVVRLTKRGDEEFLRQAAEHERWIGELLREIPLGDAEDIMTSLEVVAPHLDEESAKS
jgi:DNA-binding MarR family transcriptional regulator